MADRAEVRQKVKAYGEIVGGIVVLGVGVRANPTFLTAPVDEAIKIAGSVGTGNLLDIATAIAHVPFDVWNTLVNAGPGGIAAGIAMGFGLWLVGKGSITNREVNKATGKRY
jgi:hypothetical protein